MPADATEDDAPVTLDELMHSLSSFHVILRPVVITMCLAVRGCLSAAFFC
jgi:hypothetical protein